MDVVGFTGVPVFQAEGLTVKTEKSRYTPLFLDKVRCSSIRLGTLHPHFIVQHPLSNTLEP